MPWVADEVALALALAQDLQITTLCSSTMIPVAFTAEKPSSSNAHLPSRTRASSAIRSVIKCRNASFMLQSNLLHQPFQSPIKGIMPYSLLRSFQTRRLLVHPTDDDKDDCRIFQPSALCMSVRSLLGASVSKVQRNEPGRVQDFHECWTVGDAC